MLSVLFLSIVKNVKSILVATSLAQNKLPVTQGLWEVTNLVVMKAEFPFRQHASWCVLEWQFPAVVYTYITCFYYHIFAKERFKGWKDALSQLRALAALPRSPRFNSHTVAHNHLKLEFQGIWFPCLASERAPGIHVAHRHTCRVNTHTHEIILEECFKTYTAPQSQIWLLLYWLISFIIDTLPYISMAFVRIYIVFYCTFLW